ncbi:MAG: 3-phytase [Hyphococcus sp.]|nr:MAG: 3-phytase [Marinicaulis sp.]
MRGAKYLTYIGFAGAVLGLQGCDQLPLEQSNETEGTNKSVSAALELVPTQFDGANMAVLAMGANGEPIILGTDELGGVEIYSITGEKTGGLEAGDAESIDIRYDVSFGSDGGAFLSVLDTGANTLRFFIHSAARLTDVTGAPISSDFATTGVCLHKNRTDQNLYAFIVGENGEIDQWLLYPDTDGKVSGRIVRRMNAASEVGYCVANDRTGDIYASEQAVGVWRFSANPESDIAPEIIDINRFGKIDDETGGIAIANGTGGKSYLFASNASVNKINVYDIANDHEFIGSVSIDANGAIDGVEEPGGIFVFNHPLAEPFSEGVLIVSDDDNGDDPTNYKLVSLATIAGALGIDFAAVPMSDSTEPAPIATVFPTLETPPVGNHGDAADDPAIWVHPTDPSLSLVIGTEKQNGLYVYDLSGNTVQFLPDGKMNNVDLRYGFTLNGEETTIVTASNRTDDTLAIYSIDVASRRLVNIADGPQATGMSDPYGLCMYRSAASGTTYAIVNDTDGVVKQWALRETAPGKVSAELMREFSVGSQTEGCVADDSTGVLLIGEEAIGLWKYGAEPEDGDARSAVVLATDDDALNPDVEGVSIYHKENGEGYIVVSSQGSDSYVLYQLQAPHEFVGTFAIIADGASGIDGASETDGLDVTSAPLGDKFPKGLLVVQDGRNVLPPEPQNFKFVSWADIETSLGLVE